ncbi:flagellar hook-associated protein FlgL [Motilibacter aurantiacus]|uniref:flagellar hook-associated protein FlgL n=1 Tax=Motilibacter aurantiacus TaxID=2714955 RepID=UPI00140CD13B|nr:flagellar hook-associated protein FlgL [Motilibacter aurantiacus]NHC46239.1 flagellar hook-associated protein 3 [Motilibacter aurantiacus]
MTGISRVTYHQLGISSLRGVQGNLDRISNLQTQLSTGRSVNRPSDSPSGTSAAMSFRSDIKANTQYARNANDGIAWLGNADQALQSSLSITNRVRDLAVQAASTGSQGQTARDAIATEVRQLRESLIETANTTYIGRPVFGGTTAGAKAYEKNGSYVGDTGQVLRTVANGVQVRVDGSGPEIFGTGDEQLFTIVNDIADHASGDPAALQDDLTRLDKALTNLRKGAADIGARYNRVESLKQGADDRKLTLNKGLNEIESVDIAEATVQLQLQQVAYQAALGTASKVLQLSLTDFLR